MTKKLKAILIRFQKNAFHHFCKMESSLTFPTQLILNEYFYMVERDLHSAILKVHV